MSGIFTGLSILFGAMIGTTTGFGTSTVLVPLFLLFYPLPEVLLFVGVIHWFGNLWKIYFFRQGKSWQLLLSFGIAGIIGSFIGARLTVVLTGVWLQKLLGVMLIVYALFFLAKPKFSLKKTLPNLTSGGLVSGFLAGIFGVGGAIRGAFLQAFGLKKSTYIFTAGMIGILIDSTRIFTYLNQGFRLNNLSLTLLLTGVPISLIGAWFGKKIVDHLPQQLFRQVVVTGILIFGIYYLAK